MPAQGSRSPLGAWSRSSLRIFYQTPQQAKTPQRGPAFWSNSAAAKLPQKQKVFLARKKKYNLGLSPPKFFGITSWAQLLAVFLAVVALALFSLLMGFLNIYIQKADTLNAQTLLMRTREKRLNDAIKLLAGDQGQHCKPCGDYTWLQRAEGCYRWTDGLMPWRTCEDECQRQGGRLVKADTEGEMEFLLRESHKWVILVNHSYVLQRTWIGLFFNLSRGTWHWADGGFLHLRIRRMLALA
ncbi:C-type lectin domain family 9 member A-like [Crotalus tigris]|uniref:C-type lectin domain family 9 member A-like n=1 Tax=Crotalus tigris TaxID=88082 RepID=UPI00192F4B17|nr:C-type lectin domain family 9 member A-like [Crotalus tigris]